MDIRHASLDDRVSGWRSGSHETITSLALRELLGGVGIPDAFGVSEMARGQTLPRTNSRLQT